jgi:hypothetical protein
VAFTQECEPLSKTSSKTSSKQIQNKALKNFLLQNKTLKTHLLKHARTQIFVSQFPITTKKPINVIMLSDHINQLLTNSYSALYILVQSDFLLYQYDYINQIITRSVIVSSGFYQTMFYHILLELPYCNNL